jgi:twitching motility two-component system response regulator PilG
MQGTLDEIDISSLLQLLELNRHTGELHIQAVPNSVLLGQKWHFDSNSYQLSLMSTVQLAYKIWTLFLVDGQIVYASDSNYSDTINPDRDEPDKRSCSLLALHERLHHYHLEADLKNLEFATTETITSNSEYDYIWILLKKQILNSTQVKQVIRSLVQEILFDLFDLRQGVFNFNCNSALTPHLTTLEISPLIEKSLTQIKKWKQFFPQITSLDQCLLIKQGEKLSTVLSERAYSSFRQWSDGRTSLRQLLRYLNCNPATLAQAIDPYLKKGWLKLTDSNLSIDLELSNDRSKRQPQVIYINNDVTIGRNVEYILKLKGCRSTLVEEPIQALELIFQDKPDLILCDSMIPKLNGYELCSMLRSSQSFRLTPIIMLTEANRDLDRAKSKIAGATDYLSKPFQENELLMLIEKHLSLSNCNNLPETFESLSLEQGRRELVAEIGQANLTEI